MQRHQKAYQHHPSPEHLLSTCRSRGRWYLSPGAQTKLYHLRIRNHSLGRSIGKVRGGKKIRTQVGLPAPVSEKIRASVRDSEREELQPKFSLFWSRRSQPATAPAQTLL